MNNKGNLEILIKASFQAGSSKFVDWFRLDITQLNFVYSMIESKGYFMTRDFSQLMVVFLEADIQFRTGSSTHHHS